MTHLDKPGRGELSQRHFDQEKRDSRDQIHDDVGNEEGATPISINQVREAPQATQPHGEAQTCHQEVPLAVPLIPFNNSLL